MQWIAGASLYIYLLDHQVAFVLGKLGLGAHPLVMLGIAVLAGVAAQKAWDHLIVARVLARRRAGATA